MYFRNISAASSNPNIGTPAEPKVYHEEIYFQKKVCLSGFGSLLFYFIANEVPVASAHVRKYGNQVEEGNFQGTISTKTIQRAQKCSCRSRSRSRSRNSDLRLRNTGYRESLKVHKIENFFDSDFGICVISLLVMSKY